MASHNGSGSASQRFRLVVPYRRRAVGSSAVEDGLALGNECLRRLVVIRGLSAMDVVGDELVAVEAQAA